MKVLLNLLRITYHQYQTTESSTISNYLETGHHLSNWTSLDFEDFAFDFDRHCISAENFLTSYKINVYFMNLNIYDPCQKVKIIFL